LQWVVLVIKEQHVQDFVQELDLEAFVHDSELLGCVKGGGECIE
jgi:hypothetical protein